MTAPAGTGVAPASFPLLSRDLGWMLRPASIAVASRAFTIAVMVAIALHRGVPPDQFTLWDGAWYARIAAGGYHAFPVEGNRYDFAFFPAWPVLMLVLSLAFLPLGGVGFVASNLLFVAGALLVWRLLAERWDPSIATGAVALLSFAPTAYVFSMAYSESLFLVAVAGSMLARRAWIGALLGGVAGATRLAGLALVAAGGAIVGAARERRRLLLAGCVGALVGFGLWFVAVAILTGRPLAFFEGPRSWIPFNVFETQMNSIHRHPLTFIGRFAFVALALAGSIAAALHDRQLGLYALAVVGLAIASVLGSPVQSIARYALPAFPAYAGMADRLGRRGTLALVIVFALAEVWFASWTIGQGRVPP